MTLLIFKSYIENEIPRLVRRCRSSADEMYPLPSLSK